MLDPQGDQGPHHNQIQAHEPYMAEINKKLILVRSALRFINEEQEQCVEAFLAHWRGKREANLSRAFICAQGPWLKQWLVDLDEEASYGQPFIAALRRNGRPDKGPGPSKSNRKDDDLVETREEAKEMAPTDSTDSDDIEIVFNRRR